VEACNEGAYMIWLHVNVQFRKPSPRPSARHHPRVFSITLWARGGHGGKQAVEEKAGRSPLIGGGRTTGVESDHRIRGSRRVLLVFFLRGQTCAAAPWRAIARASGAAASVASRANDIGLCVASTLTIDTAAAPLPLPPPFDWIGASRRPGAMAMGHMPAVSSLVAGVANAKSGAHVPSRGLSGSAQPPATRMEHARWCEGR